MKFIRALITSFVLASTLVSCKPVSTAAPDTTLEQSGPVGTVQSQNQVILPVYVFKTPEPNTISARGILAVPDPFTVIPAADDAIYLVPLGSGENVTGIPSILSQGTLQAEVDEGSGQFMISQIKPGQYVVVVREKSGSEHPARLIETDSLAIFTFEEANRGQTIDLGILRFP